MCHAKQRRVKDPEQEIEEFRRNPDFSIWFFSSGVDIYLVLEISFTNIAMKHLIYGCVLKMNWNETHSSSCQPSKFRLGSYEFWNEQILKYLTGDQIVCMYTLNNCVHSPFSYLFYQNRNIMTATWNKILWAENCFCLGTESELMETEWHLRWNNVHCSWK